MRYVLGIAVVLAFFSFKEERRPAALKPKTAQDTVISGPDTLPYRYNVQGHNASKEYIYIDTSLPFETITVKPNTKAGVPFNTLDYDNVVAYDYEGTYSNIKEFGAEQNIIDEDGKLHPAVIKRAALTRQQADAITALLTDKTIYSDAATACFEPRFGLVFCKGKKVVMHMSICFACNHLRSSIPMPGGLISFNEKGMENVNAFVKSLGFR